MGRLRKEASSGQTGAAGGSGPFGDAAARCWVLGAGLCALDAYLGVSAAYVGYVRAYRRDLMREGR